MTESSKFRDDLLAAVPKLRAFALSLCRDGDRADDLVQETLVRAMAKAARFEPGTNLIAWLFTILRNAYHSQYKKMREAEDPDGAQAARLASPPEQGARLDYHDLLKALDQLTPEHREALLLVGASGFAYEEAAAICGVAVGTIKSRVSRARTQLGKLLNVESVDDLEATL